MYPFHVKAIVKKPLCMQTGIHAMSYLSNRIQLDMFIKMDGLYIDFKWYHYNKI